MSRQKLQLKVPGKLMIAGEYAVLEPHQKAIVIAVDRYITASIESSIDNQLNLSKFHLTNIHWKYEDGEIHFQCDDPRLRFVKIAMETVMRYLEEQLQRISPFHLTITSELDDAAGRKYGLGSSAAVVVAVVSSILHFAYASRPTDELIFKLAALAHLKAQGSGSGADVAASTFGGWLLYSSFQPKWLLGRIQEASMISHIVNEQWPYLSISKLHPPSELQLCVGWTGKPVKTGPLITSIQKLKQQNLAVYNDFLQETAVAVEKIVESFKHGEYLQAICGIEQNRRALAKLGLAAQVAIETKDLARLAELAATFKGAGKPSGAGGGDCGIAFVSGEENVKKLKAAWEEQKIIPLDLQVSSFGANIIDEVYF